MRLKTILSASVGVTSLMFSLPKKTRAAALSGTLENISFVSEFDHSSRKQAVFRTLEQILP